MRVFFLFFSFLFSFPPFDFEKDKMRCLDFVVVSPKIPYTEEDEYCVYLGTTTNENVKETTNFRAAATTTTSDDVDGWRNRREHGGAAFDEFVRPSSREHEDDCRRKIQSRSHRRRRHRRVSSNGSWTSIRGHDVKNGVQ